jgi:hypothetical protein
MDKPKGFLKGIDITGFIDTGEEWHAFAIGFCEVLCPWPPWHRSMHKELRKQITSEYHYYQFGRAIGVIAWLIIAKIIQEAFW